MNDVRLMFGILSLLAALAFAVIPPLRDWLGRKADRNWEEVRWLGVESIVSHETNRLWVQFFVPGTFFTLGLIAVVTAFE